MRSLYPVVAMNSSAARPQSGLLSRPVKMPGRRTLWLAMAGVALVAAGFGGWWYWTHSPPAWVVRWKLDRYIKKHAGTGNFKVDFPFPSKAEMSKAHPRRDPGAAPAKGSRTGKDFETLRDEYFTLKTEALVLERKMARNARNADARPELLAKEAALEPIVEDLWELQKSLQAEAETSGLTSASALGAARNKFTDELREQFGKAGSYQEMYRLIGCELWVARQLLASANTDHRRAGIQLAFDASRHALRDAQNGWVAARICEGFVLPHRDLADDPNRRSPFNPENFLNQCVDIFRDNQEFNNVVSTYKTYLEEAGTPQRADWARQRISMAYEQAGNPREALYYLREIRDTNEYRRDLRRVPRLEQQLKNY